MANHKYILAGFEKEKKRRQLQKTKKQKINKSQKTRTRDNDWWDMADIETEDWSDDLNFERIMPRGENERRKMIDRQVKTKIREVYGSEDDYPGRVMEVYPAGCRVLVDGETIDCVYRGAMMKNQTDERTLVTVGDHVGISDDGFGGGVIEDIRERSGELARVDTHNRNKRHVIAANIDQLLIVASWKNPHFWPELVDRYLIAAWRNDIQPVICVNKIDLVESISEIGAAVKPYLDIGVPVIMTSAVTGEGLDLLRDTLESRITVLAGLSGAGKSSLLSLAYEDFDLKRGNVNDDAHQGRHTTTQAVMLPLDNQSFVIDTPGIREFGLAGMTSDELIGYFPEIEDAAAYCRYRDCSHVHEPDCAVLEALSDGGIFETRYKSYIAISQELDD